MKILLLGYGKMGKAIEQEAINKGHEVVLKIGYRNTEELTIANIQKADVAIEFSRPEVAFDNIKLCIDAGVPVVSGTTGWLDKMEELKIYCHQKGGAFLYASNFSIGVNLFFQFNKILTKLMAPHGQYQPSIEEIHHTQKLDAPSGTAITLANGLLENFPDKKSWALSPTDDSEALTITAKRIDKVPGTHAISWDSEVDSIEIKHTAHSRKGFVVGALLAAEWMIGKEGCFGMEDVLKK
ncbi:MAG: 4-hydroxy-tetrahydrodipicolinate reductase [Polaribacter sp.]|jgi:4-hydroxy-tetrahydrodipicolinate reductase